MINNSKEIITHLVLGNFFTNFLQITLSKDQTHISLIQNKQKKRLLIYQTLKTQKIYEKDLNFKVPEAKG